MSCQVIECIKKFGNKPHAVFKKKKGRTDLLPHQVKTICWLQKQSDLLVIAWGVRALNVEQKFAMELLLDDRIKLVTLVGTAGTGKTQLARVTWTRLEDGRVHHVIEQSRDGGKTWLPYFDGIYEKREKGQ